MKFPVKDPKNRLMFVVVVVIHVPKDILDSLIFRFIFSKLYF